MRRIFTAFLLFSPLLASCTLGPRVPAPDTRLPAAFEAPTAETASGVDLDRWWTAYDDPQLAALVEEALKSAPDARSAAARLDEARAVRSSALTAFDPQGALQGSSTLTHTTTLSGPGPIVIPAVPGVFPGASFDLSPSGYTYNQGANFDVSWEVDLFGRRVATRRKANADLAAAKFDYEASRTSLAANVADQLFQARGLAIQLDDARDSARIQRDLLNIAQKKADHGLGAQSDADQVAAQTAQNDAEVADLESQLHAARRTLLVLLGRGGDPLEGLPTPAEAGAPPKAPATVPGALLARRPDVQEAAAKLHSASGQLKLDELALFPKFTLQPGLSLSSSNITGSPIVSDAWSIGLGAALPILDRPRLQAEIRAQGARADQAVIAYEKAVQTAYGEAESALVELQSDERRVVILTAGERQGRSAYDAARTRYGLGMDDLTSVLTAERTWRTARTALTGAQVQALRRSVQAFKALGGGWIPPGTRPARSS
ncbi:MAG TPA: TolC family protein [Caulobacteraceae bacterium]|nr:TolC family protein [Caulobacteraceae bacterium]